jgi:hypothetical protein
MGSPERCRNEKQGDPPDRSARFARPGGRLAKEVFI